MDRRTFLQSVGVAAGGVAAADVERKLRTLETFGESAGSWCDDIALLGVASDGSVEQWDRTMSPRGIMLRWFEQPHVTFPDYGYDLFRAPVAPPSSVVLNDASAEEIKNHDSYTYDQQLVIKQQPHIVLLGTGPHNYAIVVSATSPVELIFPRPAWYVAIDPQTETSNLRARAFSRGQLRADKVFNGGTVEFVARGIERIELSGVGRVIAIRYRLVCDDLEWTHLKHFCLPISDADYPCGPRVWSDNEQEAKSRLPPPVQSSEWLSKYRATFLDMLPQLTAVATHRPVPPFPPSSDPDAPQFGLDPVDAIRVAMLDPNVARMLGTAYDDPLSPTGLDGKWYSYKIVGKWACETKLVAGEQLEPGGALKQHGLTIEVRGGKSRLQRDVLATSLAANGVLRLRLPVTAACVSLCVRANSSIAWTAKNRAGGVVREGRLPPLRSQDERMVLTIESGGIRFVEFLGAGDIDLRSLCWKTPSYVERVGILPGIKAVASAAPVGPRWITAVVEEPPTCVSPLEAALDWETRVGPGGASNPDASLFYQLAAKQLSTDPSTPQPTATAFSSADVLTDSDFIVVPPTAAAAAEPRVLLIDRGDGSGLKEGWRSWWVRGIDLFGRVSAPSSPTTKNLQNKSAPSPPALVLAEYVQRDLPNGSGIGLSSLGREWLANGPSANALVLGWAWTPELVAQCPDVDGFRCYARRPISTTGTDIDEAATTYDSVAWGSPIASLGPTAVSYTGVLSSIPALGSITISAVQPLASGVFACATDFVLDLGVGALTGGTISGGGYAYDVVGNGDGAGLTVHVRAPTGSLAPEPGSYVLSSSNVARFKTSVAPPNDQSTYQRRLGGVLVAGAQRFLVLHDDNGEFIVRLDGTSIPAVNSSIEWYPAYAFAIPDNGIGPAPTHAAPTAMAQLTATSVRQLATRALESEAASPATVIGVDTTVPTTPIVTPIASGTYCAEAATRPDWYGISRYTLSWTPDSSLRYTVYRALGDAILRADVEHHEPTPSHLPVAIWPNDLSTSAGAKASVEQQLSALDTDLTTALSVADDAERVAGIAAAYAKLDANAQRVIGMQDHVRAAYVARNKVPLDGGDVPFVDEFDGRAKARWFYRIASRTKAGIESAWTDVTPPICAPDVVPPVTPQVQVALSGVGKVKLRWIASPDPDVTAYTVYRARNQINAAEARTMEVIARVTSVPTANPPAGMLSSVAITGRIGWLESEVAATPAGEWFFRIAAEDVNHNQSPLSDLLRARSSQAPPVPPVWSSATRDATSTPIRILLSWTHPSDQRLSCRVERRLQGRQTWTAVSEWLARGDYAFTDIPNAASIAIDYRLRVRDTLNQVAASLPLINVAHV